VIHFAYYRISDHIDLFNSYLIFQEGDEIIEKMEKFIVRQISDTNLEKARIIYFSIYLTAENRVKKLIDEMIHFANRS
jgi:hypothetical protein